MTDRAPVTGLPKYVAISEMLIREIAAGHLADGARLPPERDMAEDLAISVGTLRKALAELEDKGLLDRVQGSGNYVRHQADVDSVYAFFRLELLRGGGLPTAQVLDVTRLAKPADAPPFGDAPEGHRVRRLRSLGTQVIALEEIWLDGGLRHRIGKAELGDSLYVFYRDALGLRMAAVEDRVGVAAMPDWTPQGFPVNAGDTVGYVERVGRCVQGRAIEFSRTWFDSSRARYVARMGKV